MCIHTHAYVFIDLRIKSIQKKGAESYLQGTESYEVGEN